MFDRRKCLKEESVFKTQLLWEGCSTSDTASAQSQRQVDPLMSFGLLGFERPGAARRQTSCLGVSSEAASCSLVPRDHGCREGAATCSAWQGFLYKEPQCLAVSSEIKKTGCRNHLTQGKGDTAYAGDTSKDCLFISVFSF